MKHKGLRDSLCLRDLVAKKMNANRLAIQSFSKTHSAVVRAVAARRSTATTNAVAGNAVLSAMGAFFPLTTAKVLARESRLLPAPKS